MCTVQCTVYTVRRTPMKKKRETNTLKRLCAALLQCCTISVFGFQIQCITGNVQQTFRFHFNDKQFNKFSMLFHCIRCEHQPDKHKTHMPSHSFSIHAFSYIRFELFFSPFNLRTKLLFARCVTRNQI